jgi:predicted enzyme related to lactoylglutathione lyase
MLPRQGPVGTVVTVDVADLAATLEKVQALGGQVVVLPMDVPGIGKLAYIKDPDETIWGVLQPVSASGC